MATLADPMPPLRGNDGLFFRRSAIAMALVIVAGFSLNIVMGRSSFAAPPLVHAHALVFMGWVAIFVAQNVLATTGNLALHRRLGWLAAAWMVPMLVLGCLVTVNLLQQGRVPFFFLPLQFLVFDPLSLFAFAGLTTWAIVLRRRSDWHRRLHFTGMAMLLGPGAGRLLPMPLLAPHAFEATFIATLIPPVIGMAADVRRSGRIHPAWLWGLAVMFGFLLAVETLTYSPVGQSLYTAITAGTPGASVAPLAFPPFPPGLPQP
jgi:hypothetical protein